MLTALELQTYIEVCKKILRIYDNLPTEVHFHNSYSQHSLVPSMWGKNIVVQHCSADLRHFCSSENRGGWTRPIYSAPSTTHQHGTVNRAAKTESLYKPTASHSFKMWKTGLQSHCCQVPTVLVPYVSQQTLVFCNVET